MPGVSSTSWQICSNCRYAVALNGKSYAVRIIAAGIKPGASVLLEKRNFVDSAYGKRDRGILFLGTIHAVPEYQLAMSHCSFDRHNLPLDNCNVTRAQILKAIERNSPFVLKMADRNEYRVPNRDFIAVPPNASYVVVFDSEGKNFDVLPLLTMTGLSQAGEGSPANVLT